VRLIVRGGIIVTEAGQVTADILCVDGRIAALLDPAERVKVDEVVAAHGRLVFPGFIDPHVHSRDPGAPDKEDFAHSSLAALCGGVTCVLEMPNATPAVADAETFRDRRDYLSARAWVDFGLWGLSLGTANIDKLEELFSAGAVAVKLFWGYALHKETKSLVYNIGDMPSEELLMPPSNGEVLATFAEVARLGGLIGVHCEDKSVLDVATADLGRPISSYNDFLRARPAVAEASAIALAASLSYATKCRFHVMHVASAAGAAVVRIARDNGVPISAETCPHYLTLADTDYDAIGSLMKVYPPIRSGEDQAALWARIADGTITSVGSDHGPHTLKEKRSGLASAPAGVAGVETFVPLLIDAMCRGKLSPQQLAALASTNTARMYGLHPRKGTIRPGADADLVIVEPERNHTIRADKLHSVSPVTPFDGRTLTGIPVASILRGVVVMEDGQPMGSRRGEFLAANHSLDAPQALKTQGGSADRRDRMTEGAASLA
jgi:allantoinase